MNPLQKLLQVLRNLIGPKVTKTQKTTTIKLNKTLSSNKISQRKLPDVQIKQVERKQQQKTITSFLEPIPDSVTEFPPTIITVSKESISELEPGYVLDTCSLINFEDYPEIKKSGRDIVNKLHDRPIYVLTTSKKEYAGKKCPKNRTELVVDRGYTGNPRNFDHVLVELPKSLGVPVYLVEIENALEIQQLAKKLLPELRKFGLHYVDDAFLAFTQLTKSTMITSDDRLIFSSVHAQCPKPIEFQEFLEKIMQPSPITVMLRERRNYYKNHNNPRWKK